MSQIHITAKGIKAALKKYTPYQSIVEYVWNGFDAGASVVEINFVADELGGLVELEIKDNGHGIAQNLLQEKFEPFFESKKRAQTLSPQNNSVLHGKNGIGRLTFFTFARHAQWQTVFAQDGKNYAYDIFANAETINLYSGINAGKKETAQHPGTSVHFSGIFNLTAHELGENFLEFLQKEFAWFLLLNRKRGFSLKVNGTELDYANLVAEQEEISLLHEETQTVFEVLYVRWQERFNKETSKYYYLDSQFAEKWKEGTSIKTKGEKFFHSVYIASPYFDEFSFQTTEQQQTPLLGGTRADKQFKFLRRKVANLLRIKRKPFLKTYAENMLKEYEQQQLFEPFTKEENSVNLVVLRELLKIIYQMQPRLFSGLNGEQKKLFVGTIGWLLQSDQQMRIPEIIGTIIELNPEEKVEIGEMVANAKKTIVC